MSGFPPPFFDLHHTTQSCIVLDSSSQLSFSCSDRLSHITTVGPSFPPQKNRSPRPADWKKGGADIAVSPSILVALLICCSARNTAHVGDLYSCKYIRLHARRACKLISIHTDTHTNVYICIDNIYIHIHTDCNELHRFLHIFTDYNLRRIPAIVDSQVALLIASFNSQLTVLLLLSHI